jgi:hypothetical protein
MLVHFVPGTAEPYVLATFKHEVPSFYMYEHGLGDEHMTVWKRISDSSIVHLSDCEKNNPDEVPNKASASTLFVSALTELIA